MASLNKRNASWFIGFEIHIANNTFLSGCIGSENANGADDVEDEVMPKYDATFEKRVLFHNLIQLSIHAHGVQAFGFIVLIRCLMESENMSLETSYVIIIACMSVCIPNCIL